MALTPIGGEITAQVLNDNFSYLESIGLRPDYDELINVKEYGAVGDGQTDDTAAIQSALDDGSIFIPEGVYIVSGIKIPSNRTVVGQNWDTVLKLSANAEVGADVLRNAGIENIHIRDICLDGNRKNRPSAESSGIRPGHSCLTLANCTSSTVKGVFAKSATLHGINITAPDESYLGPTIYQSGGCSNVVVSRCFVTDCGDDGITTHWSKGIVITACVCWDMAATHVQGSNGIEIDDGSTDVTVSNCVCYNTDRYGTGIGSTYAGIEVHGHNMTPAPQRVTIANCVFYNTYRGVNLWHQGFTDSDSETAMDVTISGCIADNCLNAAYRVTSYKDWVISNCISRKSGDEVGAIRIDQNARLGSINSCVISDSSPGAYAIGLNSGFGFNIIGNIVDGENLRGIRSMPETIVDGNRVFTSLTEGQPTGIFIPDGTADVIVTSNIVKGFQENIRDESTLNTVVANNIQGG